MGMNTGLRRSLRNRLASRDGMLCHYCDGEMEMPEGCINGGLFATLEHIVPQSYGGSDDMTNLVLACADCNNARGNDLDFCWCKRCEGVLNKFFNKKFYSLINANRPRVQKRKGMWRVRINKKTHSFGSWTNAMAFAITGDKNV